MKIALKCKYCNRFIGYAHGTTILEGVVCPNSRCKAKLNFKVVNPHSSEADIHYQFETPEEKPKDTLKTKEDAQ